MTSSTSTTPNCANSRCGKSLENPLTCSRCKSHAYCSKTCQKQAWTGKNGHKHACFSQDWVEQFWSFLQAAYEEDHALTEEEYKLYPLAVHRQAASIGNYLDENCVGSPLEPFRNDTTASLKLACLYFMDNRLLPEGRGVRIKSTGQIGYVVGTVGGQMSPRRSYQVQLCHESSPVASCTPSQLQMLPLNDMRHYRNGLQYDDTTEGPRDKSLHPYEAQLLELQAQGHMPLPQGAAWEYRDEHTQEWTPYHAFLQNEIESMYNLGSPHFLYRPDAPHCIGGYVETSLHVDDEDIPTLGDPAHMVQHDVATRQVILDGSTTGTGQPIFFFERDMFTGMKRLVRRRGTPPQDDPLFVPPSMNLPRNVLLLPNQNQYCGLCHSTSNPLVPMECCGGYVCDTEEDYQMGSYERRGQCARNHRLNSICFWHFQEKHSNDDWKTCTECQDYFSTFDYAVKASSMADSGTCRRYNFDDNVRMDLELKDFPVCDECQQPVDTTEETTRTLSLRKTMGGNKVLCKYHGGGFGRVNMAGFYSNNN
jgi:MYND finger